MSVRPGPSTSVALPEERVKDDNCETAEETPLIASDNSHHHRSSASSASGGYYGMSGRQNVRKRSINVAVSDEDDGGSKSSSWIGITSFSTTTVVGLLLLLAMVSLTVLSLCLQRYSKNTYIDIIVPPQNSTNSTANATTGLIL